MSRCKCFRLHAPTGALLDADAHLGFINSQASQSSNSGWLGGVPCVPKSFSVSTRPRPKYCCQTRLTATRARSGFSGETSQRARSNRVSRELPEEADSLVV